MENTSERGGLGDPEGVLVRAKDTFQGVLSPKTLENRELTSEGPGNPRERGTELRQKVKKAVKTSSPYVMVCRGLKHKVSFVFEFAVNYGFSKLVIPRGTIYQIILALFLRDHYPGMRATEKFPITPITW